jgi:hypothetical protein
MDGGEFLFILVLLGFLAVFLWKLSNIFSLGRLYSELMAWINFIGGLMAWGLCLMLTMVLGSTILWVSVLFKFASLFLVLFFILQFIEVVYTLANKPTMGSNSRGTALRSFR